MSRPLKKNKSSRVTFWGGGNGLRFLHFHIAEEAKQSGKKIKIVDVRNKLRSICQAGAITWWKWPTPAKPKLHGITSRGKTVKLRVQGRDGGTKFNEDGTD